MMENVEEIFAKLRGLEKKHGQRILKILYQLRVDGFSFEAYNMLENLIRINKEEAKSDPEAYPGIPFAPSKREMETAKKLAEAGYLVKDEEGSFWVTDKTTKLFAQS